MQTFINTLADYIKELELELEEEQKYPVKIGVFADEPSLRIKTLAGSETIRKYMDGTSDIRLPFEISIKSPNQEEAFIVLGKVLDHVRNIGEFLEKCEYSEYVLLNTVIDQIPTFQESTDNYFYYTSKLTVDLTVI